MTIDTLEKDQNKSSVATVLNAESISDASKISQSRSAWNIENDYTTIIPSSIRIGRNEERTLSYILVIMWSQSLVLPHLIENYGITLV